MFPVKPSSTYQTSHLIEILGIFQSPQPDSLTLTPIDHEASLLVEIQLDLSLCLEKFQLASVSNSFWNFLANTYIICEPVTCSYIMIQA